MPQTGDVLVERALTSVLTGRSMEEIAADQAGAHSLAGKKGDAFTEVMASAAKHNAEGSSPSRKKKSAKNAKPPAFRPLQLATLVDSVPTGNDWMHEIKFDGYRALIAVAGDEVHGLHPQRERLDRQVRAARPRGRRARPAAVPDRRRDRRQRCRGQPRFLLAPGGAQARPRRADRCHPLTFHAFDLLELDGEDLAELTKIERKERLEALLAGVAPPIHVADHVIGAGEKLFAQCARPGRRGSSPSGSTRVTRASAAATGSR